jgi:UDP-N-acetylmuramoyl-tripeptide--D-alanyl-D-alanine ligase
MMLTPQLIAQLGKATLSASTLSASLPLATGVSFSTTRLKPGEAFFALPGNNTHGITYADEALAKGASFIVSDKPHPKGLVVADPIATLLELGKYGREYLKGSVIGITGSAGKTSTKAMVAATLDMPSTAGNLNTPLALAATLINTFLSGQHNLVLELGIDHLGEMDTLINLVKPTHGVLTLIAPSHLEGLESIENIAKEKAKLLQAATTRLANTQAMPFISDISNVKSYGLENADYSGHYQEGVLFYKEHRINLPALGQAMATNALAALALAEMFTIPLEPAIQRLEQCRLEPGRLQIIKLGSVTLIDDSYNSSPAAVREALSVLDALPEPHTAILGDMLELGNHSADYHFEIGKETRSLDHVVAIGKMSKYLAEANPKALYFSTVDEALPYLKGLILHGSVLVKASRGMMFERCITALREVLA